jgi:hypothetical protein
MHNRFYVIECAAQGDWVSYATVLDLNLTVGKHPLFPRSVDQTAHLIAAFQKFSDHLPAKKPGGARYQN